MAEVRRLTFCADDYGISPAVSAGIRELAEWGRISATSAMCSMRAWPIEAPKLKPLAGRIQVGLHFTLTDQTPRGAMPILAPHGKLPPIKSLVLRGLAGRIPRHEVAAELERQLDSFELHFGRKPDFIDGHQHVHLLPGVWDIVLAAHARRLDSAKAWVRDAADRPTNLIARRSVEAGIVAGLGLGFHFAAQARKIPTNRGFSGFYDYASEGLGEALPRMLQGAVDGHLLMIHPGHVDAELESLDSLTAPRQREFDFLMSDEFPRRLAAEGWEIASALK